MNYDLHGVVEIITALIIFGTIAFGWYLSAKRDGLPDETRMFRQISDYSTSSWVLLYGCFRYHRLDQVWTHSRL